MFPPLVSDIITQDCCITRCAISEQYVAGWWGGEALDFGCDRCAQTATLK